MFVGIDKVVVIMAGGGVTLIGIGMAAFAWGEAYARRTNDLDGMASVGGFLVLLIFGSVGLCLAFGSCVAWVFNLLLIRATAKYDGEKSKG